MTSPDQSRPVPPVEFEMERVAAQVDLLAADPRACRHCRASWVPVAFWPDAPTVVRAAELRHEEGCPALD
jgi:hypothetical protein